MAYIYHINIYDKRVCSYLYLEQPDGKLCATDTLIRKNSLFHDTPKGATASAIICSLIETAKALNLDVQKYLDYLLTKQPGHANGSEGLNELMPWSKSVQMLCASNVKSKK